MNGASIDLAQRNSPLACLRWSQGKATNLATLLIRSLTAALHDRSRKWAFTNALRVLTLIRLVTFHCRPQHNPCAKLCDAMAHQYRSQCR